MVYRMVPFKGTPLFDVEYFRNVHVTRQKHSSSPILNSVISNDREWSWMT